MSNLVDDLNRIKELYASQVVMLRDFVQETDRSLARKTKRKPKIPDLNKEEIAEFQRFIQASLELIKQVEPIRAARKAGAKIDKRPVEIRIALSERVAKLIGYLLQMWEVPRAYARFLAEMALTYLISFQEAFVKDYLKTLLVERREMLKSGKQLTFEEVCSFSSMPDLIEHLANKEIDQISYGNIDDVAKYFENHLNIMLSDKFSGWNSLREASYRRNVILHNRATTNRLYCSKTGYPAEGEHLDTAATYVGQAATVVLDFIEFTHAQIKDKLKLELPTGGNG